MIKHFAIRETCIAGRTIERIIKMPSGNHKGSRGKRTNATEEAVRKNNDIIAERNLRRKINHNFGKGSAHYTLTYGEYLPTPQEAKKDLKNFIRRMRTALGKKIKWVAVTEYNNHRIHHHIIINTANAELVNEKWGKGWVRTSMLDNSGDYKKLANYLIKETQKTFREEDCPVQRRYACSRNLEMPIIKREPVNAYLLFEDPQPIKGYYIDKDSIRRYEHPVTGIEYLEYTEIAIDEPRKYKVWPRGKRVREEAIKKIKGEVQFSFC